VRQAPDLRFSFTAIWHNSCNAEGDGHSWRAYSVNLVIAVLLRQLSEDNYEETQ
jgi:hypothetical protein